jgi:hypothetical protein
MQEQEFFERMAPEFAEHASSARENAQRQVDVERLIDTAEYEYRTMRRELAGLLPVMAKPSANTVTEPLAEQAMEAGLAAPAAPQPAAPAQPLNQAA